MPVIAFCRIQVSLFRNRPLALILLVGDQAGVGLQAHIDLFLSVENRRGGSGPYKKQACAEITMTAAAARSPDKASVCRLADY